MPRRAAPDQLRGPRVLPQARQDGGVLDLHGLKSARVEAEQRQDRRGDLGRLDRSADHPSVPYAGRHDQDRHVAVLLAGAPVLSYLGPPTGVDDTVLGDAEYIGVPGIAVRDTEVVRGRPARVDLAEPRRRDRDGVAADVVAGRGVREEVSLHEVGGGL